MVIDTYFQIHCKVFLCCQALLYICFPPSLLKTYPGPEPSRCVTLPAKQKMQSHPILQLLVDVVSLKSSRQDWQLLGLHGNQAIMWICWVRSLRTDRVHPLQGSRQCLALFYIFLPPTLVSLVFPLISSRPKIISQTHQDAKVGQLSKWRGVILFSSCWLMRLPQSHQEKTDNCWGFRELCGFTESDYWLLGL